MKFLQDYQEQAQTELLNRTGSFFAFSQQQFDESKQPNTSYVACGLGLICPKQNVDTLLAELDTIYKSAIQQDIKENGIEKIIIRELYNHECFYTGDIDDVICKLQGYGIDDDLISKTYSSEYPNANL